MLPVWNRKVQYITEFYKQTLENKLLVSLPAFRGDVQLEALPFPHGSKSALFFLGREAVALTSWLDSQKEQGGPFKTGLWMLLREGRASCKHHVHVGV